MQLDGDKGARLGEHRFELTARNGRGEALLPSVVNEEPKTSFPAPSVMPPAKP